MNPSTAMTKTLSKCLKLATFSHFSQLHDRALICQPLHDDGAHYPLIIRFFRVHNDFEVVMYAFNNSWWSVEIWHDHQHTRLFQ